MIRAFAAALEDDNLLVRRSALDMLLQTMRADSAAIKRARPEDGCRDIHESSHQCRLEVRPVAEQTLVYVVIGAR